MAYLGNVLFVSAIISMLSDQLALAGVLLILANICALTKDKSGSTPGFYLLTFGLSMGLFSVFDVVANILIAVGLVLLGIKSYTAFCGTKLTSPLIPLKAVVGLTRREVAHQVVVLLVATLVVANN